MADPEGTEYACMDVQFRRASPFPPRWGAAPADEERRQAWIVECCKLEEPRNRARAIGRGNAARMAVLTAKRYDSVELR